MINEMLLRKNKMYFISEHISYHEEQEDNTAYAATIMKNIEEFGYTFSEDLFKLISRYSIKTLAILNFELISAIKSIVGADHTYKVMYSGFPEEVMDKEESTLYINAIFHYISSGRVFPYSDKVMRSELADKKKYNILEEGTREDATSLFSNILSSGTSISQLDADYIGWCFENIGNIVPYIPKSIPIKENVAIMGKYYIVNCPTATAEVLSDYFKTPVDVLRLAAALSNADVSLAEKPVFISLSRRIRRILMDLLEESSCIIEGMAGYREEFKRLGERLHPSEYNKSRYHRTIEAFKIIRSNNKIPTFAGRVESAINRRDVREAVQLLQTRPGELARRLDVLLRMNQDNEMVLDIFRGVASEVSTPVLLQLREHFTYRNTDKKRYYFPKGIAAKARIIPLLEYMDESLCRSVVNICEEALISKFRARGDMGKVYISEKMKNYIVPFNERTASKSLRTLIKGSRIDMAADTKATRCYIWWTNTEKNHRVDIDLSAAILDGDFRYMQHVSYTNLRADAYRAYHSGDIVDGGVYDGAGVSEFIDVDIDSVIAAGGRYIVYQVYCFTNNTFAKLPHVAFGYMERVDVNSGEIYEPSLVRQKIDLVNDSRVSMPVMFDCVSRQIIWCDMNVDISRHGSNINNVENNLEGVELACYAVANMHKTNIYDLIMLHVMARCCHDEVSGICNNREEADIIFDEEEGITPYDIDIIAAEYIV